MEKRSFIKEAEIEFEEKMNHQIVKWTIMYDSDDPTKKYLKLYVDAKDYSRSYVFGEKSKQPRTLFMHISEWLYQQIMHKDNAYDLFYDSNLERSIRILYFNY